MSGGQWVVPETHRPPDWRERMEPRAVEPPKEKAPWLYVAVPTRDGNRARGKGFQSGHPRYAGRKPGNGRVQITAKEIASRCDAGETVPQIALSLKCDPSLLWRRMQKAKVKPGPRMCCDCGKPTGKAPQAKRCAGCAEAAQRTSHSKWQEAWLARVNDRMNDQPPKCIVEGCVSPRSSTHAGKCSRCYQKDRREAARVEV